MSNGDPTMITVQPDWPNGILNGYGGGFPVLGTTRYGRGTYGHGIYGRTTPGG